MDEFAEMKGPGRRVFSMLSRSGQIDLVRYPDQSLAILCNQIMIGLWEAASENECLATLMQIAPCDPVTAVLLVRTEAVDSSETPLN